MTAIIEPEVISVDQELPPEGKIVIVVCKNIQVLGFLGTRRVWREAQTPHHKLEDVVGWYDEAS